MPWSNFHNKRHARLLVYFFALVVITALLRQFIQPSPSPVVLDLPIVQTNASDHNANASATTAPPLQKTVSIPTFTDTFWPSFESWKQDGWSFSVPDNKKMTSRVHRIQAYVEQGEDLTTSEATSVHAGLTVIVRVTDQALIQSQIQSLATQTLKPRTVWLIVPEAMDAPVSQAGMDVRVVVQEPVESYEKGMAGESPWLATIAPLINNNNDNDAAEEWVWILDHSNVQPTSPDYAASVVHLANSSYQGALLGTMNTGILLPSNFYTQQKEIICLADDDTRLPHVVQPVDMLTDSWFMRKTWLSLLSNPPSQQQPSLYNTPTGYYISQALQQHGNIPTLALPSLPQLRIHQQSCKRVQQQWKQHQPWKQLFSLKTTPTALDYRQSTMRRAIKQLDTVLFVVDGVDQAMAFIPLMCRFEYTVHAVVTGAARGLEGRTLEETLRQTDDCSKRVIVHDLNLGFADDTSNAMAQQVITGVSQLIKVLEPRVVLYTDRGKQHALSSSLAHLDGTVSIGLPIDHIIHALWIAQLPLDALEQWHRPEIKLVIITDRRPHALSRLFQSADRSFYLGDKIDLVVHLEQSSDPATRMLVNGLEWRHGTKILRHRIRKGGLMPAIVESWYPGSDDEYAVLLEDDVEVSPLFYVWAKYSILQYRYHQSKENDDLRQRLYGVSLYSPRNLELHPAGRRPFHPDHVLVNHFPPRMPYVSQVPCSWGAVYFPEHWREFHQYLTARLADLDQPPKRLNITVPDSRSERWKKSWKKYFIELVYLRAYVMLYPNFQEFESFSTNHLETGTHVKSTTKRNNAIHSFLVPLMQRDTILAQLPNHRLPSEFEDLPVLDLWGYLRTHDALDTTAAQWHARVSTCERQQHHKPFDASDLLCPFSTPPTPDPVRPKKVKVVYAVEPIEYVKASPNHDKIIYDPEEEGPVPINVATLPSEPDDGSVRWDDAQLDLVDDLMWMNQLYDQSTGLQDILAADAELDLE